MHNEIKIDGEVEIAEFGLTDAEKEKAEKFMAAHHVADRDSLGATRVQFSFTFSPTTVGNLVHIRDKVSGDSEDITDTDSW